MLAAGLSTRKPILRDLLLLHPFRRAAVACDCQAPLLPAHPVLQSDDAAEGQPSVLATPGCWRRCARSATCELHVAAYACASGYPWPKPNRGLDALTVLETADAMAHRREYEGMCEPCFAQHYFDHDAWEHSQTACLCRLDSLLDYTELSMLAAFCKRVQQQGVPRGTTNKMNHPRWLRHDAVRLSFNFNLIAISSLPLME